MFTKEDILTLLREGADPTELANKFADVLNESVATLNKEKEERKAKEQAHIQQEKEWKDLIDHFIGWMHTYIPDVYNHFKEEFESLHDVDSDTVISICNDALSQTKDVMAMLFPEEKKKEEPKPAAGRSAARKTDASATVSPDDLEALLRWVQGNNF